MKNDMRKLLKHVPNLVKSSLVEQAMRIEKVVASTFELSDRFLAEMGNVPPHYIEQIKSSYQEGMFEAYDMGYNCPHIPALDSLKDDERLVELKQKCPFSVSISQEIEARFKANINDYVKTMQDTDGMFSAFNSDLQDNFARGMFDFLEDSKSIDMSAPDVCDPCDTGMEMEVQVDNGIDQVFASTPKPEKDMNGYKTKDPKSKKDVEKSIMDYINQLPTEEAKRVMKHELGIATASTPKPEKDMNGYKTKDPKSKKDVEKSIMDYINELDSEKAKEVLKYEMGIATASTPKPEKDSPASEADRKKKLMGYINLLKDKTAREVLMVELGLAPKKVKADLDLEMQEMKDIPEQIIQENEAPLEVNDMDSLGIEILKVSLEQEPTFVDMCGPYIVSLLKDKTIELLKSHKFKSEVEDEYVLIECPVTGINHFESKEQLASAICNKLELVCEPSLEAVEDHCDILAMELSSCVGLPGSYIFVENNNNFCLLFVFNKEEVQPVLKSMALAKTKQAKKDLPEGPQGTLSTKCQAEIEACAKLKGDMTFKDLQKASPQVAKYVSEAIKDYRNSKKTAKELASILKAKPKDLCGMVWGGDGEKYYDHVR